MTRPLADNNGDTATWLTPQVILAAGAVLLVLLLVVAFVLWRVYRRARRSGAVQRGLLALRAQALPAGPGRELARLRQDLHASLATTEQVIHASTGAGPSTADLAGLLGQLTTAGTGLDVDLRMLEHNPDPDRQAAGLRLYRPQVEQLLAAAADARQAITETTAAEHDTQVQALTTQVGEQVGALAAYRQAYRELTGRD